MKDKLTIAVCGLMDSGKSTLIKTVMMACSGRTVQPDALCIEQETGKTITGTRIACPVGERLDVVLIDCPGHIEYLPEIVSGLCAADAYITIIDEERHRRSLHYAEELRRIADAIGCPPLCTIHSHSHTGERWHYDIADASFDAVLQDILCEIERLEPQIPAEAPSAAMPPRDSGETRVAKLASVVWLDRDRGEQRYDVFIHGLGEPFPLPGPVDRRQGQAVSRYLMLQTPPGAGIPAGTRALICRQNEEHDVAGVARFL